VRDHVPRSSDIFTFPSWLDDPPPAAPVEAPFDPASLVDALFAAKVAIWTTPDGRLDWHDHDSTLDEADQAHLRKHEAELVAYLTGPPTPQESQAVRRKARSLRAPVSVPADTTLDASPESLSSPADLSHREIISRWPIDGRERWGRLANELADRGFAWPDDEIEAYRQILEESGGLRPDPGPRPIVNRRPTRPKKPDCQAWMTDASLTVSMAEVRASIEFQREVTGN